ncbi:hypothetical protein XCR_0929 [Xanthomonas campestris pv. raphani 756C]|nr:hypothetical protein XCR_0929 [Xanthomonas campestris pv. raphani 756C]
MNHRVDEHLRCLRRSSALARDGRYRQCPSRASALLRGAAVRVRCCAAIARSGGTVERCRL